MKKLVIESLNEGFATEEGRKMDRIFRAIGYGGFQEFIGDNPGCVDAILSWIDQYFGKQLAEQYSAEELDEMGLYGSADIARTNEEENTDDEDYEGELDANPDVNPERFQ